MNDQTKVRVEGATALSTRDRFRLMPRWQRWTAIGLPIAVVGIIGGGLLNDPEPAAPPKAPPIVTVAQPLVRDVAEWDNFIGRFAPSRTVDVRPRVSGEIVGVHFRDGQIVQKGALLFTIDARPFAAALAEARAQVTSASSALALARSDLGRALRLVGDEAVSEGEVDSLRARVQAAEGALSAAQARVRSRALDVEFTRIRAPITGRISDRRVDPGNQVAGGSGSGGTLLTTVNALDPIYFTFNASEALYLKAQRSSERSGPPQVEIRLQDEGDYRWRGRLDFTDNSFDTHSGVIRGRVVLANPTHFLTPGIFGEMRLSHGSAPALLIPDAAIQADQARKLVLTVGPQNKLAANPVELGPLLGDLRVIRSGLKPGDRVVIAGGQASPPDTVVDPKPGRVTLTGSLTGLAPRAPSGTATLVNR